MKPQPLLGVQYLRAIAACLVVLHHTYQIVPRFGRGDLGSAFPVGAAGVDLFFVISGFLMVRITQAQETEPGSFVLRRFARVAPLYWLATAAMAFAVLLAPAAFQTTQLSPANLAASLAFMAYPRPLLQVGWTLNLELLFYVSFAVAMAVSHRRRAVLAGASMIALSAWSPVLLEFVLGMAVAAVAGRVGRAHAVAALGLGCALLAATVLHPSGRDDMWRPILWGVPSALVVLGAVRLEGAIRSPALARLGDASYAIYLTHLFTLGAVRLLWAKLHLGHHVSDAALLSVSVAASCLVGWLAHIWVELPIEGLVRRSLRGSAGGRRIEDAASIPAHVS